MTEHAHNTTVQENNLSIQVQGHLGMIALDRVQHLNALSIEMIQGIHEQLKAWSTQDHIQAVLIHSNSPKAFCAGGDIRYLYDGYQVDPTICSDYFAAEYAMLDYIRQYAKPVVVLLDGYVLGGGFGLAQACHIQVSSEKSRFAMPETAIGYFPDVGATYFLSRLDEIGTYMALTGEQISSSDALYLDLVDYHVPSEKLIDLQEALSSADFLNVTHIREIIRNFITDPTESQIQAMAAQINQHFGHNRLEEIMQSLQSETQSAAVEWTQKVLNILHTRPVMALQTSLKLQQIGQNLSLQKSMQLERDIQDIWMKQGDFIEGVRALIVDKDKNPQWQIDNSHFEIQLAKVLPVSLQQQFENS